MLQARVNTDRLRQAAIWASRHRVLTEVCAAAAESRIDLLVFKGAHLAYHLYPDPADRRCADVDVFVRPAHRSRLLTVLERLGFTECSSNIGDLALGQTTYERTRVPGSVLDVHSRIVTPFATARRFAFERLWERSTLFAAFPSNVRVPALLDALHIALIHQHVHHPGERADEWILDVHLLIDALQEEDLRHFCGWLSDGTIPEESHDLIRDAVRRFPTDRGCSIAAVLDTLQPSHGKTAEPRVLRYIRDLRSVPPHVAARVVAAHLFPSAAYMRGTYAPASHLPLLLLYPLRILRGVTRAVTAPSA